RFRRCLVVVPAALTSMWRAALVATRVEAELLTFEALSRVDMENLRGQRQAPASYDLVVVDEAHHVRNPRTNRYFALESLVRGARVLLLSATPIHNHRDDLVALLSLFLGSRARAMTSAEFALCVVRREKRQLKRSLPIPRLRPVVYHDLPDDSVLVQQLMDLPPPLPLRDGGLGGALIGRGLVHQWASSEAALNEAVRRRIARATALCASLEAGTYPTARELETWTYGDGALQLGFAELLSAPVVGHEELLGAIRAHLTALEEVRAGFALAGRIDAGRAQIIAGLREAHTKTKIVAFAQYAETVSMLFRRLVRSGGVAMLTSHGARVAGGSLTRREAISRFAPRATGSSSPASAERIDLLLTTDLLSEGVNLQDAHTVVHLDIPWTAARMEQRVGRVARLGSRHAEISVAVLRPPRSAMEVLSAETIVQRKWGLAKSAVGSSAPSPSFESNAEGDTSERDSETGSTPGNAERLRTILDGWLTLATAGNHSPAERTNDSIVVATVQASEPSFVAAVSMNNAPQLLAGFGDGITTDLATQVERCENLGVIASPTNRADVQRIIELIQNWFMSEKASAAAGLGASSALRRREITSRIDASIESAPPDLRTSRLLTAARARKIATTPQGAPVERELDALLRSDLPLDEWLTAVADLDAQQVPHSSSSSSEDLKIHAILVMRVRPHRSRSPRAQGSP
ncbi:MAG TPA: helicase-related protein, partial [Gemmatimonadaceae bacterium]|nr:helicase-related protein [Gemmatimonadaceae bacterium]